MDIPSSISKYEEPIMDDQTVHQHSVLQFYSQSGYGFRQRIKTPVIPWDRIVH